jgi:hypothetical protein
MDVLRCNGCSESLTNIRSKDKVEKSLLGRRKGERGRRSFFIQITAN